MPAGDLIVRDGQYEFQTNLFNGGAEPFYMIEKVDGLWAVDMKPNDFDNQVGDGVYEGTDYTAAKQLVIDGYVLATTEAQGNQMIDTLRRAWQPQTTRIPFVFQKAGITGKQVIYVRPRKLAIPTSYTQKQGYAEFHGELLAPDPRVEELTGQLVTLPDFSGGATNANVNMTGWYNGGAHPLIEIDGPITNPRITNNLWARTMKIDVAIPFGQTLIIDEDLRTIEMYDGAFYYDYYQYKRTDHQWWVLTPGVQNISATGTGTTSNTHVRVRWNNTRI